MNLFFHMACACFPPLRGKIAQELRGDRQHMRFLLLATVVLAFLLFLLLTVILTRKHLWLEFIITF